VSATRDFIGGYFGNRKESGVRYRIT